MTTYEVWFCDFVADHFEPDGERDRQDCWECRHSSSSFHVDLSATQTMQSEEKHIPGIFVVSTSVL